MKKSKSNLHSAMGEAESKQERNGVSPHYREHPEKKDRVPRPAHNGYHTDGSGVPIAQSPEVFDREPGRPEGADGFRERLDKIGTQGKADHRGARGRDYTESKVDTSDHTQNRSDIEHNHYVEAHGNPKLPRSSFGGKVYKV